MSITKLVISLLFILLFSNSEASENNEIKLNSFNVELGGAGGFYSFHYNRTILFKDKLNSTFGIGISPQLIYGLTEFTLNPTYLFDFKAFYKLNERNSILFGIDYGLFYGNNILGLFNEYTSTINCNLGYKYDFKNRRNYFSSSFTPWIYYAEEIVFIPWVSFSFGYKFNKIEHCKISHRQDSAKFESFSGSLGIVNYKLRLQYERGYKKQRTMGAQLTYYFGEFPGAKLEGFIRQYYKKSSSKEGLFLQEKVGGGYLLTGMYDEHKKNIAGYTIGGGIAGGYKIMIGNHLNLEAILGLHYYVAPIPNKNSIITYGQEGQKQWWYSTTGFPLDFQFKFGWQY